MRGPHIRVNAFGRHLLLENSSGRWKAYDIGDEGKRRRAFDIVIPPDVSPADLVSYLDDLLHENATAANPRVVSMPD